MNVQSLPASDSLLRVEIGGRHILALWREGRLHDLSPLKLDGLLGIPAAEMRDRLEVRGAWPELEVDAARLTAPVEGQEVWAAGVTYLRSRDARVEESSQKDVYQQVYEADRPELFFKAAGWRVVGDGGAVGVRPDSSWDVPEPELAVLSNSRGEVVVYGCGNDMSLCLIEGENFLYLF